MCTGYGYTCIKPCNTTCCVHVKVITQAKELPRQNSCDNTPHDQICMWRRGLAEVYLSISTCLCYMSIIRTVDWKSWLLTFLNWWSCCTDLCIGRGVGMYSTVLWPKMFHCMNLIKYVYAARLYTNWDSVDSYVGMAWTLPHIIMHYKMYMYTWNKRRFSL